MDLKLYYNQVNEVIKEFGISPDETTINSGNWQLVDKKGNILNINIFNFQNRAYFQCFSVICKIPEQNKTAFYQDVLEQNDDLFNMAMVKSKDFIILKNMREAENMDKSEIKNQIVRLISYTETLQKYFTKKYFDNDTNTPDGRA